MPAKFKELADYNADRKRLVFTPEYEARMTELQAEFNEWVRSVR